MCTHSNNENEKESQNNKVLDLAKSCLKSSLCNDTNKINQDDYLRAEVSGIDFGDNSAVLKQLLELNPDILQNQENLQVYHF